MAYDSNKGGITTKSDAGTMIYNYPGKPYAPGAICPTTGLVPSNTQTISYTSFESVSTISENNYVASLTYNPEAQRANMVVQQSGNTILTRWYSGSSYVKETAGGVIKQYTYIGGDAYTAPVVAIKTGTGTPVYYYLLRDHLGSITHVVNTSKTTVAEYSYDSWGRMRNPTNWTNYAPGTEPSLFVAGRGFTGHEHLLWFNSINMNGRVYDPLIGQFLSPDNYVQDPTFTQNYNRYTYCLNNPLSYKDPSGMLRETLPNPADAGHPYNPEAAAWLANYYNRWEYNYGGGGGGGGYGTMGSGFYDTGHPAYNTSDVLGSIWNDYISHNPAENVLYSYVNVNGDWYNAYTTTFIYPSRPDPWTQGLTASLEDYVGIPQGGGDGNSYAAAVGLAAARLAPGWVVAGAETTAFGEVVMRVTTLGAAAYIVHANSRKSQKPNIVYEIYSYNSFNGCQTMKYGVSGRAGFVKRSGNPRPEYQVMFLNAAEPVGSGTFYWYTVLNRTPDRASSLSLEQIYVRAYQATHGGLRPPLQIRP